ncbi:hypothetical protein Tco_1019465 [Tanacetum coccineum]|uniref:Uncharacterized protein n=1 Tax=Tanacetum coccineum TaxID=301880 RepID=A0ABQ5FXA6_9ASTR
MPPYGFKSQKQTPLFGEGGGDEGVEVMVTRWIWVRVASAVGGSHGGCVVMLVVLKVGNGVDDDDVDEVEMVGVVTASVGRKWVTRWLWWCKVAG